MSTIALKAGQSPLDITATPPLLARLDPRSRVLAALVISLAVVACQGFATATAAVVLAAVLACLARLPLAATLRRLLGLEGFMLLTLASLPFTMGGTALFSIAGMTAGSEGLARAALILIKVNAAVLTTLALIGTMELSALGHALARLRLPTGFITLFLFTVRYIDVLYRHYARLRLAMRARGFRPRASLHCWCSLGHLIGMLLVGSLERSERIHAAMRLRGFDGRFHLLDDHRPQRLDWIFAAAVTVALLVLAALERS